MIDVTASKKPEVDLLLSATNGLSTTLILKSRKRIHELNFISLTSDMIIVFGR